MGVEIYESGKKKLRIQKYPDTVDGDLKKWHNLMIEKRVAESWEDIWSSLNFALVKYPSKVEALKIVNE